MKQVIVIGGGAAGMLAALQSARCGNQVRLIEKNEKLGKKIYITGKGRCNVTNAGDMETLFRNVITNRKFLYSAFYGFTNTDMMDLLEESGCPLKTERGNRVFPVSDKASDITAALQKQMQAAGVEIMLRTKVKGLLFEKIADDSLSDEMLSETSASVTAELIGGQTSKAAADNQASVKASGKSSVRTSKKKQLQQEKRCIGVVLDNGKKLFADKVIVATGGLSYPSTGSTGDGYRFAKEGGHTVTALSPGLVPFTVAEPWAKELQGLSLRNVDVTITDGKKTIYQEFGEMLFTHFGVSGPAVLSGSSVAAKKIAEKNLQLHIDLKPALTPEQLDERILRDFEAGKNKQFKNALNQLFPSKLIPVMVSLSGIEGEKMVHSITKEERQQLVSLTKNLQLTLNGLRDYNEAIITQGGVSIKEINPATMESKLVQHLYFAGEVLDVDALTGGYNLQIAWSTGYAAGCESEG